MENERIINLFIIEDNALYAAALKQYLLSGFEKTEHRVVVETFKTAESCLEWFRYFPGKDPDIIILDYFLNNQYNDSMNGVNAMFHLKATKPKVQIIFLSGQDKIEVATEAMRRGAYEYIVKNEQAFQRTLKSAVDCIHQLKLSEPFIQDDRTKSVSL